MAVKLFVTDVDGTLLNTEGRISQETKQMVNQIRQQGMDLTLATGRDPRTCQWIIEELDIIQPIITHNGASIYDPVKKTYLHYQTFDSEELSEAMKFCKKRDIYFHILTKEKILIEKQFVPIYEKYFPEVFDLSIHSNLAEVNQPIVKMALAMPESDVPSVWSNLEQQFPGWYIVAGGEQGIDIHRKAVNKGEGLKKLSKMLDIKLEDIVTFGNYYNDLELLEVAGTGVAVENAPEKVKNAADRTTASCGDSGVANYLSSCLKKIVI
ncbi:Cof-type HAD-IIB family hydrolase [Salipaludibacillus aurantiacus]|uniref:Cof subfamily of IIB subfamily of haloacid dehalogenase superfamily/HAD-superfamily hydrolase, subfamily IIB n=1 Tax=Salipaludibacillus aurantiacus TaxID=1601833 RepID=A0A1H9WSU7_9BACI|nr:Cof-type HAD-IIB family hydrolase [Salipaludibacillus aurantiacus]SES36747.1 hypothetical protein SAMN05518684_11974 [Salipaludibacillus aurantiacus]